MYHDEGPGTFNTHATEQNDPPPTVRTTSINETFQSHLSQTVLIAPTSKEQCKEGGWQTFGALFTNQGQCIRYVNEHKK